jgi:mono/diheme cytochrome c family protein
MKRTLARRLWVTSLVTAGAAASVSACSSSDPPLPPSPVHIAAVSPPPISGGTLIVSSTGRAVAADSDRDLVWMVDLASPKQITKVALQAGDEPGRVVEDGSGRVHVALRGAGAVATIDLTSGQIVDRTAVCSAPRGLAYDAATDVVHVACAGGELVTLPAGGGAAVRALRFADRDLRDVVVQGDTLLVTRFREAEVLLLDSNGNLVDRNQPPQVVNDGNLGGSFSPEVAWRAIPSAAGGLAVMHQLAATTPIVISQPGGYGGQGMGPGGCDTTIVRSQLTQFSATGKPLSTLPATAISGATLPVDVATDANGNFAIVSAGSNAVFLVATPTLAPQPNTGCTSGNQVSVPGQPVAVALSESNFLVQLREPAQLILMSSTGSVVQTITLPGESRADTGHSLFHQNAATSSFISCASCHPEGHDDGHTWTFDTEGPRRTPTVAGRVLDTAPLHWDGDMSDLSDIMENVFVQRMGGAEQGAQTVEGFGDWLNSIPTFPPSPTGTQAQIASGQQIFERVDVGCAQCHNGKHFTNNKNETVGTGASFQVPPLLGVAARAPYMHDGCAATLADRLDPTQAACNGGDKHGHTSQLSQGEVADLIAYLETL